MKVTNNELIDSSKSTPTLKEQLTKYAANWYLFLIIIVLFMGAGYLYTRYKTPKYMATTSFLVKNIETQGSSTDLIEEGLYGKKMTNLYNEMLIINSFAVMERVVKKDSFNISYLKIGRILDIDIYHDAPFWLRETEIPVNTEPVYIKLKTLTPGGGSGTVRSQGSDAPFSFTWNQPFEQAGKKLVLIPRGQIKNGDGNYLVTWRNTGEVAAEILGSLSVTPFDTKTNAIELSLKSKNLQKGRDILNALFREFDLASIEERTRLSDNSVAFINERLMGVTDELKGVEGNLEKFQSNRQIVDVKEQSQQSLSNSSEATKIINNINVQQRVTNMLSDYFDNPANSNKLVPSSLGLTDPTLTSLLTQYNELQLKKERESPNLAPQSTVMQDLNAQTSNLKSSILENLNNIKMNLKVQENNFIQQNRQFSGFLSSVPQNERALLEIKRKQSITEGLYLYLLQKREEAAISKPGATVSLYKQIDKAIGYGPVEPNIRNWMIITFLFGVLLSFGIIFLRDRMNDKVRNREDLASKLDLKIFGDIGHASGRKKSPMAVLSNSMMSEQFRGLRTDLYFSLKNKSVKTILITSSSMGEGKSFIALNLAAVCAATGKKVALLEFDIRKQEFKNLLHLNNEKGITEYLNGETNDTFKIFDAVAELPELHIYTSGGTPSNASDLLLSENVSRLFDRLKTQYDYIIVDSAPVGLVSDAFVLGQYSDQVLYVIRQRMTPKKQLDFVSDIATNKKLSNIGLVLNDVKSGANYDYYNYGYGKYNYPRKRKFKFT